MPDSDEKRIKFCRYCDGVIEWGTKVCPHCGETLEVLKFDDLEFVSPGVREVPPRRSKKDIPVAKPLAGPPPSEPAAEELPTVKPLGAPPRATPGPKTPKRAPGKLPVVKPIGRSQKGAAGKKPPLVKPIGGSRAAKPAGKAPVVKPLSGGRSGRRGGRVPRRAPGAAPTRPRDDLPVAKPISPGPPPAAPGKRPQPPIVQPIDDSAAASAPVPTSSKKPVAECPVCDVEMESAEDVGAVCSSCEEKVCLPCLLRANGIRASASAATNRERWNAHLQKTPIGQIRCPACGQRGMR